MNQDMHVPLMDVDYDIAEETNNAVAGMVQDFQDINKMMGDINQMANAQQTTLDTAEANIDTASTNLDHGISELREASALRRGCCGCCGVPACFKPCACGKNKDQCWCSIQ